MNIEADAVYFWKDVSPNKVESTFISWRDDGIKLFTQNKNKFIHVCQAEPHSYALIHTHTHTQRYKTHFNGLLNELLKCSGA